MGGEEDADQKVSRFSVVEFDCLKTYPDVVQVLEDMLAKAKAGELIGIAACFLFTKAEIGTVFTEGARDNIFKISGGVQYLQHRIQRCIDEA